MAAWEDQDAIYDYQKGETMMHTNGPEPGALAFRKNRTDVLEVMAELERAAMHGTYFASLHEAWAVIEEELDEIHDIMRMKRRDRNAEELRKEFIQLAAMAHKALGSMDNFVGGSV